MDEKYYLDFEKPILDLETKIKEIREMAVVSNEDVEDQIEMLERRRDKIQSDTFANLTRWQIVQLARHPMRPYTLDFIELIFTDFVELHGDRYFSDDKALVGGWATIDQTSVMVVGQQKGRDVKQRQYRNFGMCHPEGYRKALRLFKLASRFKKPIIIFIDTPGAYPGIGAEERGQAEAIAKNIKEMFTLEVPIIIVIIGEGASGGALGIGIGDVVLMLENSWYSVISPEGCAAILWKKADDPKQAEINRVLAAEALKPTGADLMSLGIIDDIIAEPPGGSHRDYAGTATRIKERLILEINRLKVLESESLMANRLRKFRQLGFHEEI
jgi:acetyl-CoA carboxylase carboxyl transferase subunit alpha